MEASLTSFAFRRAVLMQGRCKPERCNMSKLVREKIWRDAATLIVVAKNGYNSQLQHRTREIQIKNDITNYVLLMLQRHSKSSFMPSAYVFPGGVIDKADYSEEWIQLYKEFGFSESELRNFSQITGPRPPLFKSYETVAVNPDVAFRICAIREAFEECGLMLFKSKHTTNNILKMDYEDVFGWRQKVHKNAFAFIELCREHQVLPDIWSLREWSNWLTPGSFGAKRFDTMFYICAMDHLPFIQHDEKEMSFAVWSTPKHLIKDHVNCKLWLAPPQFYEMSRLLRFQTYKEIREFIMIREDKGSERLLPVRIKLSDGIVSLLPGDDKYELVTELANAKDEEESSLYEVEDDNVTITEFRKGVKNFNRMELISRSRFVIICNQESCGHYSSNFTTEDYIDKSIHSSNL